MEDKQIKFNQAITDEKKKHRRKQIIFLVIYFALYFVCDLITGGKLLSQRNFLSIVTHAVYYGVLGIGLVFVMTPGFIDLSVGAMVLLASNIGAVLCVTYKMGYTGLILGCVVSSVLMEVLTIAVAVKLKIPDWIAGLSMAMIYEAILTLYSNNLTATQGSAIVAVTEHNYWGQIPGCIIVWAFAFVVGLILFNYTKIGVAIRALGNNPQVAVAMGIKKDRTMLIAAAIGGAFMGLGALVIESMNTRMMPCAGMTSVSQVFKPLAVFLLASSFQDIIDLPYGMVLGSAFMAALFSFMTLIGIPSGTGQDIMLGCIVIACGLISKLHFKGVVK